MTDDPRADRDDGLTSELEALLAVDAAPDFRVRVRAALGTDGVRAAWWRRPSLATSASAIVAAVMVVILWPFNGARDGTLPALPPPQARVASAEPTPDVPVDAPAARRPPTRDGARGTHAVTRGTSPRGVVRGGTATETVSPVLVLPDVILAEDEVLGLRLLLTPPLTHVEREADVEPAVRLADIQLREIVLEPLALSARLEEELP